MPRSPPAAVPFRALFSPLPAAAISYLAGGGASDRGGGAGGHDEGHFEAFWKRLRLKEKKKFEERKVREKATAKNKK
jgi:hypothetical protein